MGNILKVEHNGDTISLDYGRLRIGDKTLHFFGTPGQERFEIIRDVIMRGMQGAILVIDSTKGIGEFEIKLLRKLKKEKIPLVVALNKWDLNSNLNVDHIPEFRGIKVIPMIATKGIGIKEVITSLIKFFIIMKVKKKLNRR